MTSTDEGGGRGTAHAGMGAIVHAAGVAFRVWAPNATSVMVIGDFNEWDGRRDPLVSEGNGYWYADVSAARAGHEYRFALRAGDRELTRIDPYARQVTTSVGNGVIYDHGAYDWQGDDFATPPLNQLVIYEMHVGSFVAGDERPGTFADVAGQLDHLGRLGVNALQLMPVMEFAGDYSWGYNPAHIFAVESAYGGPDGLKGLVRRAHERGIAVLIDVVYNHFGPSDLDLWQFDGWSQNGKGGIYFYNDDRSDTPWGDTRPDYGREEVRRFIRDNALMWLRDYHADGLRFDMTPYIRTVDGGRAIPEGWSLMQWVNGDIRAELPGRILIAEDLHDVAAITLPPPAGAGFHAQWDARFVHPVRAAVIAPDDDDRSTGAIAAALTANDNGDVFQRVIYTESHDEVANGKARVPHEIHQSDPQGWHAQKRSTLGAGLVFTAPGIPMIFQGQEFLQGEWFRDDVPLDWDLNESFRGITRLYRDLIRLRRNVAGATQGLQGQGIVVHHQNDDANVLAFQRWDAHGPGDDVVVVANFGHEPRVDYRVGMPTPGRWSLVFNSDASVYSDDFDGPASGDVEAVAEPMDGLDASATVTVGSYAMLVFVLPPARLIGPNSPD